LTATGEIDQLAEQYDQLRNQQAGYVRTLKMTDIANQMVSMASRSDLAQALAQAPNYLSSDKASDRLKGASILIAYPEPKFLGDLISALEREVASEKPPASMPQFGWGVAIWPFFMTNMLSPVHSAT
jgi:hypothetical protein